MAPGGRNPHQSSPIVCCGCKPPWEPAQQPCWDTHTDAWTTPEVGAPPVWVGLQANGQGGYRKKALL